MTARPGMFLSLSLSSEYTCTLSLRLLHFHLMGNNCILLSISNINQIITSDSIRSSHLHELNDHAEGIVFLTSIDVERSACPLVETVGSEIGAMLISISEQIS